VEGKGERGKKKAGEGEEKKRRGKGEEIVQF